MSDGQERRRGFRQRVGLEVEAFSTPAQPLPDGLKLVTINLAANGLRCASNLALDVHTRLIVKLRLVGGETHDPPVIRAEGLVVRCTEGHGSPANRRYEIAIDFARIDPDDRRRLTRYIGSL